MGEKSGEDLQLGEILAETVLAAVKNLKMNVELKGKLNVTNYTRNEWGRSKLHSKRVGKIKTTLETSGDDQNYTRNEWETCKLHSKRV